MKKAERAIYIQKRLEELYPNPSIPLTHLNDYTLLVAVLLSAQCTDKKVNEVTKDLFRLAYSPKMMCRLNEDIILDRIKQLGLAKQKARHIYRLSEILIRNFQGQVPRNYEDLESLPGVGHKTAGVVLSQAYGIPTFPVDTHIHRLAQRWDLTKGTNVRQTERDLKELFPKEYWNKLHLQIIYYGREHCTARGCDGRKCLLCQELFPRRAKPVVHLKA